MGEGDEGGERRGGVRGEERGMGGDEGEGMRQEDEEEKEREGRGREGVLKGRKET